MKPKILTFSEKEMAEIFSRPVVGIGENCPIYKISNIRYLCYVSAVKGFISLSKAELKKYNIKV